MNRIKMFSKPTAEKMPVKPRKFAPFGLKSLLALCAGLLICAATPAEAQQVSGVYAIPDPLHMTQPGDEVFIYVEFDQNMTVNIGPNGAPTLKLNLQPSSADAFYVDYFQSAIIFQYTVRPGDFTENLNYLASSSLHLPAGTTIAQAAAPFNEWKSYLPYPSGGLPPPSDPFSLGGYSDVSVATMTLTPPSPATVFNGQTVNLTLSRGGSISTPMNNIHVTYPPEITGPSPVSIPALQDNVLIPVTGYKGTPAPVTITVRPYASAPAGDLTCQLDVEWQEITLSGPANIPHNATAELTLRRDLPLSTPLAVGMIYPAGITGPAVVTLPANQDLVAFTVTGAAPTAGPATIRGRPNNYPTDGSEDATHNLTVDMQIVSIAGPNAVSEGASLELVMQRQVPLPTDLTVTMTYPPEISGPAVVTIPAHGALAAFTIHGELPSGGPVIISGRPAGYPTDGSLDITHPVTVVGITPYLELTGGVSVIDEGESTVWTLRRRGSGSTSGDLTVNLTAAGVVAAINLPSTVFTIMDGDESVDFTIEAIDGAGNGSGVSITASAVGYADVTRGLTVMNVPPVILGASVSPLNPTITEPVFAQFTATDVAVPDQPGLTGRWIWGDGSADTVVPMGTTASHNYVAPGTYTVTLVVTDKDGGSTIHTMTWDVEVSPGNTLTVTVPGSGYRGLAGIGTGTVAFQPAPSVLTQPDANTYVATFRESQASVRLIATPDQPDGDGFNSYVYQITCEGGMSEISQEPLYFGASHVSATATITMGEDRAATVLFSREWIQGDNRGDIDGDGLTDEWEIRWGLNAESGVGNNGRGGSISGERMPNAPSVVAPDGTLDPDGNESAGPFGYPIPWETRWTGYAPVGPLFSNIRQFRGETLNIWDADRPNTDPNVSDTGGHGMGDGWLYYFYANAVNDPAFEGEALDPTTLISGVAIPNADIVFLFNPAYDRGLAGMDLDGDGLTTLEEYYLGTNPLHWDTDGDGMPDGWEVLFGLDPLNRNDGSENPDQDFMADDGQGRIHADVYEHYGFDPRTAWARQVFRPNLTFSNPTQYEPPIYTRPFTNLAEYQALRWRLERGIIPGGELLPADWLTWSTDPLSPDTDMDRMPDGWELYVGLEPADPLNDTDGPLNADAPGDSLSNMQEFRCRGAEAFYSAEMLTTIMNAAEARRQGSIRVFSPAYRPDDWRATGLRDPLSIPLDHFAMHEHSDWLNKFWPTDPNNPDTDRDQISDSDEYTFFRYQVAGVTGTFVNERCYVGGGLNPTSADTDGDWLPDLWEHIYAGGTPTLDDDNNAVRTGMDGTFPDAADDYDNDGLANYQEYLVGALWHFNYDKWSPGRGYGTWDPLTSSGGYDPIQFFWPSHEFGPGCYGESPYTWDLGYWYNPREGIRFFFQKAEERDRDYLVYSDDCLGYATTDPRNYDSDGDGMDDFYELYHGLNPIWSMNEDLVTKPLLLPDLVRDARVQPWQVGDEWADPDGDGIPNWEEALHPNRVDPQPHHTDPTPYWFTDMSYSESFVNLYYQPKTLANMGMYYWADEPYYMFSFEMNEGYDTDNDGISDKQELISSNSPGLTDPLDFNDPDRRVALYLDGNSAARTQTGFFHGSEILRTWTVELWMRPSEVATGTRQILIERPAAFSEGDPMPVPENVRRNFRIGIDEDGYLFTEYDNDGNDLLTQRAKSDYPIRENDRWYHVAAVFTGEKLQLYIDGTLYGGAPAKGIPANGSFYANPDRFLYPPIVIGAADSNPYASVHGGNRYLNGFTIAPPHQPDLHSFFKGHISEVRVWDGVRTPIQIRDRMSDRLRRTDVSASQAARAADRNQALLLYHYNFATLHDPVYETWLPDGYETLNSRPSDGSYPGIPWWRQAQDRSTVYDNYLYVPWVENTVAHMPMEQPFDSVYWSETSTGGEPATNDFQNTSNPYAYGYLYTGNELTEWNPEFGGAMVQFPFDPAINRHYNNLLPLRGAVADRGVEMWDGRGPGANLDIDSNGDGIPDWWYVLHGYDPFGESIAHLDPDEDGLSNYWEYRLELDPFSSDTNGDGVADGDRDFDGDGLSNWEELNLYLTDPTNPDTDNDGLSDKMELDMGLDPTDSLSPFVMRHLRNDGSGHVAVPGRMPDIDPDGLRLDLNEWTLEATVRLLEEPQDNIILIQRRVEPKGYVNYELGITVDRIPYVYFQNVNGHEYRVEGYRPVPLNEWTYLGGRYGEDERGGDVRQLALFQDSVRTVRDVTAVLPVTGIMQGDLILAANLIGDISEVRIWNYSRSDQEIEDAHGKKLLFGADVARMGSLRPMGPDGDQLQGYMYVPDRQELRLSSWSVEAWIRTDSVGEILSRNTTVGYSNYRLAINADGRLMASFDILTTWSFYDEQIGATRIANLWVRVPVYSSTSMLDNEWHHVGFVFNGTDTIQLLIDGRVEATSPFLPDWNSVIWLTSNPLSGGVYSFLEFVGFADQAGPLDVGRGFSGLIDEVRIYNQAPASVSEIQRRMTQKADITDDLVAYFDVDDSDPRTPEVILDKATQNEAVYPELLFGDLRLGADIALETGDNAPVQFNAVDILRPKLAAYFPLDDGRSYDDNGHFCVEDFVHALSIDYQNWVYAGSLLPSTNAIDYLSFFGFGIGDYSDPMQYPENISPSHPDSPFRSFPIPLDSPWRMDSDGDGMPDIFEQYYRLDPNRAVPPERPELGPFGDLDGDGLVNLYEYYAGTDPTFWDSDSNGISDADEDSDGDGISNIDEQRYGTHPGRVDTDDDGFTDGEEIYASAPPMPTYLKFSNPADSMDPLDMRNPANPMDPRLRPKSMVLDAKKYEIPTPLTDRRRFNTPQWTVEAWVRTGFSGLTGSLVQYVGESWNNGAATPITFYELGLQAGKPYIKFQSSTTMHLAVAGAAIPANIWVHLAGVFDPAHNSLNLYRDGVQVAALTVTDTALSDSQTAHKFPGKAWIGSAGIRGNIDHVRVWNVARNKDQILYGKNNLVQVHASGLICNFRFDDGGEHAEDFANRLSLDDLERWLLYVLRDITFDASQAVTTYAAQFDDKDGDGLADWWEDMHFYRELTYYRPVQAGDDPISGSVPMTYTLWGSDDAAFAAADLGWYIDFTPLRNIPGHRWSKAPDKAWMFKDFWLDRELDVVEVRMAGAPLPNTRLYLNGDEIVLSSEAIDQSVSTFDIPVHANVETFYIPDDMFFGSKRTGYNRIAIEIANVADGDNEDEYFNLELFVNGKDFKIRRGDDPSMTDHKQARWWVYSNAGSNNEPPMDANTWLWYSRQYARDALADQDGDGVNNQTEFAKRTNPYNRDSDGDGIPDNQELALGFDPNLPQELVITGITVPGAPQAGGGMQPLSSGGEEGCIELAWQWQSSDPQRPAETGAPAQFGQSVTYVVEFSPSLSNPDWQPLQPEIESTSAADSLVIEPGDSPSGFYRVRMILE